MTDRQRWYHEEYLKSDHWQRVRLRALEYAGYACQVCNSTIELQVHHRTYEHLGEEPPADLTVLCRRCHTTFHNEEKRRARAARWREQRAEQQRRKAKREAERKEPVRGPMASESEREAERHRVEQRRRDLRDRAAAARAEYQEARQQKH